MIEFFQHLNWISLLQIIVIDLLLGGDNAILIAMACRNLSPELRLKGILWGTAGAILIRIILITFAMTLLQLPFVKLVGGALLLWIGVKLLIEEQDGHVEVAASSRLAGAIKTIIIADLVMSIDNVTAVASAAEQAGGQHQLALVVIGILISIPIVVWGSTLVLKLMERMPMIITFGAGLLGYLGGAMMVADTVVAHRLSALLPAYLLNIGGWGVMMSVPGILAGVTVVGIGIGLSGRINRHDVARS